MRRYYLLLGILIITFAGTFLVLIVRSNQISMLDLLKKEARSFLSIVALAQKNSIFAEANLEDQIVDNLINIVNSLNEIGWTKENLEKFSRNFNLNSVIVMNLFNRRVIARVGDPVELALERMGSEDKLSFHYFNFRNEKFIRFIYRIDSYLVQIELSAEEVKRFSNEFGISRILNELGANPAIKYLALQDTKGIILATPGLRQLSRIENDPALKNLLERKTESIRIINFEEKKVLEVAQPFIVDENVLGVFRIGMNLDNYYQHIKTTNLQLIFIFLILILIIFLLIFFSLRYERIYNLQEVFSKILGAIDEGIILVDKKSKIIAHNKMFCFLTELEEEAILNKDYFKLFTNDPFSVKIVMNEGRVVEEEKEIFKRVLKWATYPLFDQKKKVNGTISIIRDVTKARKFEKEQEERERLQFLGNLVANFAHEIKNPLNGLSIAAQRINREFPSENPEYCFLTSTIVREIDSLNRVVNDFLSLVRPRIKEKYPFNLSALIKDIITLIQEPAKKKGIKIKMGIEEKVEFTGDAEEIKRAILNIVLNAIESVSERTGKVEVNLRREEKEILIEVGDNGPGISEEIKDKIFEPYFTTRRGGTGLGLYIAKKIIKDYNGRIVLKSTPGTGSVFTIHLPV
uniref:histidine kinase n=1 Tax=candidate division WOR-3 bacterium TaxID=2052148 RepID=A0A7C4THZ4_UNCW3